MRVDNVKSNTFGAIYYLKKPMVVAGESIGSKTLHEIVDRKPNPALAKIIENCDFFKSLSEETDVFISTQKSNYKRDMFKELTAVFMDPYDKTKVTPDEFNIQLKSPNNEVFYEKLESILINLPQSYADLKKQYGNQAPRVILDYPNLNWFITQGRDNAPGIR